MSAPLPGPVRVIVPRAVATGFDEEVRRHPHVEVGGKYLGYVRGEARHPTVAARRAALGALTFEVIASLDAGPRATRTATYHQPDRDYQLRRFREIEDRYPQVEHLGTWHSHHPNGLRELSAGDIEGYRKTVNDSGHGHDYFLASLGVDLDGFATARHFVFVRGDDHFYEIPAAGVEFSDFVLAGGTEVPGWTDSPEGRRALARDRRLVDRRLNGLRYHVKESRLILAGEVRTTSGPVLRVQLLYPSRHGGSDGLLKLDAGHGIEFTLRRQFAADVCAVRVAVSAAELLGFRTAGYARAFALRVYRALAPAPGEPSRHKADVPS